MRSVVEVAAGVRIISARSAVNQSVDVGRIRDLVAHSLDCRIRTVPLGTADRPKMNLGIEGENHHRQSSRNSPAPPYPSASSRSVHMNAQRAFIQRMISAPKRMMLIPLPAIVKVHS